MVNSRGWGFYSNRLPEWSVQEVGELIEVGDLSGQFKKSGGL